MGGSGRRGGDGAAADVRCGRGGGGGGGGGGGCRGGGGGGRGGGGGGGVSGTHDLAWAVRVAVEAMEQRLMFAAGAAGGGGAPWVVLPALDGERNERMVAGVAPGVGRQVFYVDTEGAMDVDYHGPVTVE